MPVFDFACKDCGDKFDLLISNWDKEKVKCPNCGSSELKQLLSIFARPAGASFCGSCFSGSCAAWSSTGSCSS